MTVGSTGVADRASAGALSVVRDVDGVDAPWGHFVCECFGPNGELKWREEFDNVVTTAGKQMHLNVMFGGTAKPTTWNVLLKGTGTAAAADTLATHAGWTELVPGTAYTGNRPAIAFGAATVFSTTGAQVTNGTAVSFSILVNSTVIAGAGVAADAATGTTGVLYNIGDFASSRTMGAGDSLNVTITLQQNP
jgi:hypothetical protein